MAGMYPGKQCIKKVADMTPYEREQNRIYRTATSSAYRKKYGHTAAFKLSKKARDKRYTERHPDRVKFSIDRYRASVKADPVKSAKQLKTCRILNARYVSDMNKCYIKKLVSNIERIPFNLVSDEMVAAHRATLTIKRLTRTMN